MLETDVMVSGAGTIYLFHLESATARRWVEENVSDERQVLGLTLAVEHRSLANLVQGMVNDGLTVTFAVCAAP